MATQPMPLEWSKLEYVAGIAHDLKTPLATIATSADLLEKDFDPATYAHLIEIIQRQALRLQTMIRDLSEYLTLESGTLVLHPASVTLTDLVRDTCRDFQEFATTHRLDVKLPASSQLIRADPAYLHRILENLLSNAVKYSPIGSLVLVSLRFDFDSNTAIVEVEDEGPGIQEELREKVFEPFVRMERDGQGQGLGLHIVKILVEAHGGRVQVERATLGGAKVCVSLPILGKEENESRVSRRRQPGRPRLLRKLTSK
jgi:signal transduction histidine kinase